MGIPEELKQVQLEKKGAERSLWQRKWEHERGYNSGSEIGKLTEQIEALKVKEQGLVDKWNADKLQLTGQKLQKELRQTRRKARREFAQGSTKAHPERSTTKPPPRRASGGTTGRYVTKRRAAPRPRPRQQRRR